MARQVAYAEASGDRWRRAAGQPLDRHLPAAPARRRSAPALTGLTRRPTGAARYSRRPGGAALHRSGPSRSTGSAVPTATPTLERRDPPVRRIRRVPRCARCAAGPCTGRPRPVCFCCRTCRRPTRPAAGTPGGAAPSTGWGTPTHRRLRGYKDAPVAEVRDRCRRELVDELAGVDRRRHGARWSTGLGCLDGGDHGPVDPPSRPAPAEALVDGVPAAGRAPPPPARSGGRGRRGHLRRRPGRVRPGCRGGPGRTGRLSGAGVRRHAPRPGRAAQSAAAALRWPGPGGRRTGRRPGTRPRLRNRAGSAEGAVGPFGQLIYLLAAST